MGEYAQRKLDGIRVKIGTCDSMYYLRYEDRDKVSPEPNSLNPAAEKNLFWRLPFPDEDNINIGEYQNHRRGLQLYKKTPHHLGDDYPPTYEKFGDNETAQHPGTIQLKHTCGLLINVKCYHGVKLPDCGNDAQAHWNGKNDAMELVSIKNTNNGPMPIVHCRHCGEMWRYDWGDVLPYVPDAEMRKRLETYAAEYTG